MFVLNAICNVLRTDQTVSAMKRLQKNLLQNLSEQSPDILKGAVIETEMLKKGGQQRHGICFRMTRPAGSREIPTAAPRQALRTATTAMLSSVFPKRAPLIPP